MSPIYGVEASGGSASLPDVNSVHLNGSTSLGGTISCSNNRFVSFAMWAKADSDWTKCLWAVNRNNSSDQFNLYYAGHLFFEAAGGDLDPTFRDITVPSVGAWHHFIGCLRAGVATKLYIDDVSSGAETLGTAADFTWNGKDVWVGDDGWDGSFFTGDLAYVSLWPGIDFFSGGSDISEATRRLFIDAGGLPVDPSVAIASLGTPAVMLAGGSTTFADNSLGSSGAFSIVNGSLQRGSSDPAL